MNIGERKKEESKPQETLYNREKKDWGLMEGRWEGGWAKWVMGLKEDTCDKHWVLYISDESLNSTPETNIIFFFL